MATRFSLKFKKEAIEIESETGVISEYTVTELNGPELSEYMNSMNSRTTITPTGEVSMKSFDGMYSALLRYTVLDDEGKKVPVNTLESWPVSVQKSLFEISQRLNGLDNMAVETAKNA